MRDCREKRAGLRDQDLTSRPHFLASALEPVFSRSCPFLSRYYSRPKRNRRQWLCKNFFGGGGINKVHYGLRENGERLKKISENQFCFSENVKCPI